MRDFLSNVDRLSGSFATFVRLPKRLMAFGRSLSGNLGQISDSDQVIGGGSELEDPTRHRGVKLSQRKRKRVEEIFGWLKTVGLVRWSIALLRPLLF